MAVRVDASAVPTLDHAQAAAEVLADEGASQVLLFGSVADGTARAGSDIDLVAVFDDIDYEERYPRRWRLEAKCAVAAGVPVEVHVTDWPEWRHRTGKVRSSFEAAIACRQRTLFEQAPPPGAVRWDKEIGMPDSDLAEAVQRLGDVAQSLREMTDACRPSENETSIVDGREQVDAWVRTGRLRGLCADASMTIENSLKAWSALNGAPSERTHSVARLLDAARPLPDAFEAALAPLQANTMRPSREAYDDITGWRVGGTYSSALPQATPERTERLARLLTGVALTAAEAIRERLLHEGADPGDERMANCGTQLRFTKSVLSSGDVVAGVVSAGAAPTDARARGRLRRWLHARPGRQIRPSP